MKRAFVLVWLAFQIGLPIAMLFAEYRPAPFGWQMYSATRNESEFRIEWRNDSVSTLDFAAIVPRPRAELDYSVLVPRHVCGHFQGVRSVVVTELDAIGGEGTRSSRYECEPHG